MMAHSTPTSKKSGVVLLVDDDAQLLALVPELLANFGFYALTAADGRQALAIFRRRHQEINLVLLDVNLPHTDGFDLLAGLQAIQPSVKIIIASGFFGPVEMEKFLRAGVAGVIQKPFRAQQLHEEIIRVLGG